MRKAAEFVKEGVRVRAECPLSLENIDDAILTKIYTNLHEIGAHKLLLMRLFSVGRAQNAGGYAPSANQYRGAIALLREHEANYGFPKISVQCALKFFDNPSLEKNPCDLMHESFGLMWDGTLLASPWAINKDGKPLAWVLGNLATTQIGEILGSEKAQRYFARLDHNFGHCKIHAWQNSRLVSSEDRLFDSSDPLIMGAATGAA